MKFTKYICKQCFIKNNNDENLICRAMLSDKIIEPHGCLIPEKDGCFPKWEEEKA